jgi:hypothetical protein
MPVYKYKAIDETGRTVQGILDESWKGATENQAPVVFLSSLSEVRQERREA